MQDKQGSHHSVPPSMLMNGAVVAPSSYWPCGSCPGSFRRALTFDELLQIDPLSLRLSQQCATCPRCEVADNNTVSPHYLVSIEWICVSSIPDEKSKNHNTSHEVVNEEEYSIRLGNVLLRLLTLAGNADSHTHNVDPPFQRNNLKEDQKRRPERVEGELG